MKPTRAQQGFTLIELVVVIVILGILAATALPKFINLQGDAAQAAADGVAGAISSAAAVNYSKFLVSSGSAEVTTITSGTTNCNTLNALLSGATMPTNVTLSGTVTCTSPAGAGGSGTCTVTHAGVTPSKTATARVICTG